MPSEPVSTAQNAGRGLARSVRAIAGGLSGSPSDKEAERKLPLRTQIGLQILCLFILLTVLVPGPVHRPACHRPAEPVTAGQHHPAGRLPRRLRAGPRPPDVGSDQLLRTGSQQLRARHQRGLLLRAPRRPGRLRVLPPEVQAARDPDDRRPGRADAAGGRHDRAPVHHVEQRRRRSAADRNVQSPGVPHRGGAGGHLGRTARSRSGISRGISTRSRRSSRKRQRWTARRRTRASSG